MKTATISSKNQITLPKASLRALHLKSGSRVVVEPRPEGLLVRPLSGAVTHAYYGYAKETWRALGGGEKHLTRERRSWK